MALAKVPVCVLFYRTWGRIETIASASAGSGLPRVEPLVETRAGQATVSSGMRTLPLVSGLSITAVRKTARPIIVVTRIGPDNPI